MSHTWVHTIMGMCVGICAALAESICFFLSSDVYSCLILSFQHCFPVFVSACWQYAPGRTLLGRHMGLRWFALLVNPCVALLLNLFSVFCHLGKQFQSQCRVFFSAHLHCLALSQVLGLAFFSRSDFVAGVLTLLL